MGAPTLLQMGNTTSGALPVPFPAQPACPSLFPKNSHYPDFIVFMFLVFFIVHPHILKFSFAFVCVYLVSGVWYWRNNMSYTKEEGFTVGSAFQAFQGMVLKLKWASESPRGFSKTQMAHWAPFPCRLWFTRSGVRTETLHFKPISKWCWWSWVSTTLWESYTQDMWDNIQGCHKFIL